MSAGVDVVVVGAGVIGLACAAALARAGRAVLGLERHARPGEETSSHNSEVVHAGMYYPTGSLKARLTVAGNRRLYAYCAARGVPHAKVGKIIIATTHAEERRLEEIRLRGLANGVRGLKMLQPARIASREPNVRATAGLLSVETGIVDAASFMASLCAEAREAGADFAFRHALVSVERTSFGYRLGVRDANGEASTIDAGVVINAAGLASDEIAALAGIDVDHAGYRLRYVKGRYFRVHGPPLVRGLVYPIPPTSLAGLGVHATVDLAGGVRLGPDVEPLPDRRYDYSVPEEAADAFFASASPWLVGLRRETLAPDQAGIRPKLAPLASSKDGFADFVVVEESARGLPGWVNLVGLESPGLTCALEIAEIVLRLVST